MAEGKNVCMERICRLTCFSVCCFALGAGLQRDASTSHLEIMKQGRDQTSAQKIKHVSFFVPFYLGRVHLQSSSFDAQPYCVLNPKMFTHLIGAE